MSGQKKTPLDNPDFAQTG